MVTSFSQYVLNNGDRLPAAVCLFERPRIIFLPDRTAELSRETHPLCLLIVIQKPVDEAGNKHHACEDQKDAGANEEGLAYDPKGGARDEQGDSGCKANHDYTEQNKFIFDRRLVILEQTKLHHDLLRRD